jgi:multidrug resistance efflux pump
MSITEPAVYQEPEVPIDEQVTRLIEIANGQEPVPLVDDQLLQRVRTGSPMQPEQETLPSEEAQSLNQTLPVLTPAAPPRRRLNKRVARSLLGIGILVLAAWSLIPLLYDVRSSQAVVTAPVITIRSPIDGMVTFLCQTASGANAGENTPLLEVKNSLADDGRLDVLKDERALLDARIDSHKRQLAGLTDLRENLVDSARKYQDARLRTLELEHDGADFLVKAAQAVQKQRENEKEMYARLQPSGAASTQEADAARFTAEAAQHTAAQVQKSMENLAEQIKALRNGVHVGPGDGRNDLPYSAQRLHEISFRMEELRAVLRQDEARLAQLTQHIQAEEERLARRSYFTAKTPADWVVWRRHAVSNTAVKADNPLLDLIDPREIFVDAVISEKDLAHVHPGDTAHVRLVGSSKEWKAVVKQVVGSTLPWTDQLLAAEAVPTARQKVHVILSFSEPFFNGKGTMSAPVGLPAEVTFVSLSDLFGK